MPRSIVEVLHNDLPTPSYVFDLVTHVGVKQCLSNDGDRHSLHFHENVDGSSARSDRLPAVQHFLCGLSHQRGQECQALAMKSRLRQPSPSSPRLPIAGQQPFPDEWLEEIGDSMLLGVIVIIILEDMLDGIGMVEKIRRPRTARKAHGIAKVAGGGHIDSQEVLG